MVWNAFHQRHRTIVPCLILSLTVTTLDNGFPRPDTPLETPRNIRVEMTGVGHQVSAEHNVMRQQSTLRCRRTELIFIVQWQRDLEVFFGVHEVQHQRIHRRTLPPPHDPLITNICTLSKASLGCGRGVEPRGKFQQAGSKIRKQS